MKTDEQRLDEAREELARAVDGETAARLTARIEILEARIARLGPNPHMASIGQGMKLKFDPIKHPRARAGRFRATGEYHGPNPQMASIGQTPAARQFKVGDFVHQRGAAVHGRVTKLQGDLAHVQFSDSAGPTVVHTSKIKHGAYKGGAGSGDDAPSIVKKIRRVTGYYRHG